VSACLAPSAFRNDNNLQQSSPATLSSLRIVFYLVCCLIVYGSLYPFDFSLTVSHELIEQFLRSWREPSSRGDILGNIALFVPYGLVGYLFFGHKRSLLQTLLPLCLIWLCLAVGSQLAQFLIPSRSPSLFDLYGNGLGFLIGVVAAYFVRLRTAIGESKARFPVSSAMILLGLWVSARLLPFVPTINWQSYKESVKPLLLTPRFVWSEFLLVTVCWLVAAHLAKSILGYQWRSRYLPMSIVVILTLEVIIVKNEIALTGVCAGMAATLLWFGKFRYMENKPAVLAWLLLVVFAIDAIFPIAIRTQPVFFNWLPLSGFLQGSMLINAVALVQKLFVFGSVLWLLKESRVLSLTTAATITAIVAVIEVGQIWIAGKAPELTDPLLVLTLFWLLQQSEDSNVALTSRDPGVAEAPPSVWQSPSTVAAAGAKILSERVEPSLSPVPQDEHPSAFPERAPLTRTYRRRKVLLVAGAGCLAIMLSAFIAVRLPGMPYNVRELFWLGGDGIDLFFFSLALLGFGWGSAWMGTLTATSRLPVIAAPFAAMTVSTVIYMLFTFSVTPESISDVVGSPVMIRRIGAEGLLGQNGTDFVASLGAERLRNITNTPETLVRFGALVGPFIIFLGIVIASRVRQSRQTAKSWFAGILAFLRHLAMYLLFMLPWLYFCKVIVFDWWATDNLVELIAPDGGGYLYGLIGLITLSAGLLAWSATKRKRDLAILLLASIATVPLGWWLLNAGLADDVGKYGLKFSGVDFLLGPDRENLIPTAELFWRWSFIQLCTVAGLAFGAALHLAWVSDRTDSISGIALGKDSRLNVRRKVAGSELAVRLHRHQLKFLKNVTQELGGTLSSTIGDIIDCLGQEMHQSTSVESGVYREISSPSTTPSGDLTMASHSVALSHQQMTIVLKLQEKTGVSASRAVRRLVDIFIHVSTEQAKETAATAV
jgi:VanZ family protein